MFLDNFDNLAPIAQKSGFVIFAIQPEQPLAFLKDLKISLLVKPNDKGKIDVDTIREIESHLGGKQQQDFYVVVSHAEAMNESAANAFLKNLEEPRDNYHFIFFTAKPSKLLPTILSRAQLYFPRQTLDFAAPPAASNQIKTKAKELIAATPAKLPQIAEYYHKQKSDIRRQKALEVVATAIEILYKTYFLTHDTTYLQKLPKFLKLYEALQKNGHVKLHIVADLI